MLYPQILTIDSFLNIYQNDKMCYNVDMNRPTRFYSNKQEKQVAKAIGGRQTINSGATNFSKGDVQSDLFLIECKTKVSSSKSMVIQKDWILKNEEEAFAMRKPYSALAIDFGSGDNYYIINEKLFKKLLFLLREDNK